MFGSIGIGGVQIASSNVRKARSKPKPTGVAGKKGKTVTGQPATLIQISGQVFEADSSTAVITYGRFNPPTLGHELVAETIYDIAEQIGGKPMIFTTETNDRKANPLSFVLKQQFLKEAFGPAVQSYSPPNGLVGVLKDVSKTYKSVIVVIGEDRAEKYTKLLSEYNGKDFSFDQIVVYCAGSRSENSSLLHESVSATDVRQAAREGDYEGFCLRTPTTLSEQSKQLMYSYVRIGLGLAEALEPLNESANVLNAQQRAQRARLFDRYRGKIERAREIALRRRGTGIVINKRAKKLALELMRKKFSAGQDYHVLPYATRASIDARVRAKKKGLLVLARKLVPHVKALENARLTPNEDTNQAFESIVEEHFPHIVTNVTPQQLVEAIDTMLHAK